MEGTCPQPADRIRRSIRHGLQEGGLGSYGGMELKQVGGKTWKIHKNGERWLPKLYRARWYIRKKKMPGVRPQLESSGRVFTLVRKVVEEEEAGVAKQLGGSERPRQMKI